MQTAIEYIFQQLEEQGLVFLTTKTNEMTISISASDYLDIKRLAKEMEKQQIIDIVEKSRETGLTAEYLLLTYGSKGSDVMTPENHIGVLSEAVKKETTSSQTEISDEEIRKAAIEYANNVYDKNDFKHEWRGVLNDFIAATKWYREQLKQL